MAGGDFYVMWQHILPQVMPVLTVVATLQVAQMILQETALSFLGLGMPPPAATWGEYSGGGQYAAVHCAVDCQPGRVVDYRAGVGDQHARQWLAGAV